MREPQLRSRVRNGKTHFYAHIARQQVQLGTKKGAAERRLKELIQGRPKQSGPNPPVEELINKFLAWSEKNNEPRTYEWYSSHLDRFKAFLPSGLRLAHLKRFHLTNWLSECYAGTSANYRNGAGRCAKRALQWAEDEQIIEIRSPLAKAKLPEPERRELTIDDAQWANLLNLLENRCGNNYDDFREFLTVIWETGCRPYEARIFEARYFDRACRCWRFPTKLSKGKKSQRVVYLTEEAFAICERRTLKHPDGPIFRQRNGRPWDKNAIRCKFRRLKAKLGLPELCCYTLRHSFATRMLQMGVDSHVVAKLLGHTSTRMLEQRYSHIDAKPGFLLGVLTQASNVREVVA
jgi:integrase